MQLILKFGMSHVLFYDNGITGYDPITGQYLTGFERLVTLIGVLPVLGVAGANLRYADEFIDTGDSLARYILNPHNLPGR